ncbi:hypothetical protein ACLOJK_006546 [Asimina triloba]
MNFIDDGHFQDVQAVIFIRVVVIVFSGDPSPPSSSWRIGPPATVQAVQHLMARSSPKQFFPNHKFRSSMDEPVSIDSHHRQIPKQNPSRQQQRDHNFREKRKHGIFFGVGRFIIG